MKKTKSRDDLIGIRVENLETGLIGVVDKAEDWESVDGNGNAYDGDTEVMVLWQNGTKGWKSLGGDLIAFTERESVTFNKDNWSGEMTTIEFRRDDERTTFLWRQYGYEFKLALGDQDEDFIAYELSWDGKPFGATVIGTGDRDKVEFYIDHMGISREADNPVEAAAKMIFNTV